MYLRIENDIAFPSPEADIEFVEVLGKDGEVAIDHNRLKGVRFPVPVQLRLPEGVTVDEQATKISNWLKNDIGWKPLNFSGSPDHEYIAICYEQFDIRETLKNFGKTIITFRLKPYKYTKDNQEVTFIDETAITNDTARVSKPYIKVTGTGDITLQNNGEDWLVLTGVEEYIEIDSEAMVAYKGDRQQNDKMKSQLRPMFPLLQVGENIITSSGNVESIEIVTRLEWVT